MIGKDHPRLGHRRSQAMGPICECHDMCECHDGSVGLHVPIEELGEVRGVNRGLSQGAAQEPAGRCRAERARRRPQARGSIGIATSRLLEEVPRGLAKKPRPFKHTLLLPFWGLAGV